MGVADPRDMQRVNYTKSVEQHQSNGGSDDGRGDEDAYGGDDDGGGGEGGAYEEEEEEEKEAVGDALDRNVEGHEERIRGRERRAAEGSHGGSVESIGSGNRGADNGGFSASGGRMGRHAAAVLANPGAGGGGGGGAMVPYPFQTISEQPLPQHQPQQQEQQPPPPLPRPLATLILPERQQRLLLPLFCLSIFVDWLFFLSLSTPLSPSQRGTCSSAAALALLSTAR
mmetsp:Transcript_66182/g.133331  ORF Transcript_66182/g.133331 Transcript_66182/m.133331 type:complete len:227 (+) Transcript_66182:769-1449(+)